MNEFGIDHITLGAANAAMLKKTAAIDATVAGHTTRLAEIAPDSSGVTDPTTSTVGVVKQRYLNTATGQTFICVSKVGEIYTWEAIPLKATIDGIANDALRIKQKASNDFLYVSSTAPWTQLALASGTYNHGGEAMHPGYFQHVSHSSNANSGYMIKTGSGPIILSGSEKSTVIFKTGAVLTGVIRRMGFLDTSDHTAPVDGVYAKQDGSTLTGQTASGGVTSTTGTSYTLAPNTWYRLVIELNAELTLATFTLYADNSATILWTGTLSTNIPTTGSTGHGDVCTLTAPSGATIIGTIDYMDIILPTARRVV